MTKNQIATATALLISGFMAGQITDSDTSAPGIEINESTALEVEINGVKKYIVEAKLPDSGIIEIIEEVSPCVIPDSPDEKPVDCLCDDGSDAGPRWRGANVCPRNRSSGTQCIPHGCRVISGLRNMGVAPALSPSSRLTETSGIGGVRLARICACGARVRDRRSRLRVLMSDVPFFADQLARTLSQGDLVGELPWGVFPDPLQFGPIKFDAANE